MSQAGQAPRAGAVSKVAASSGNSQIDQAVAAASKKYGVPEKLIKAVIKQESGGNPQARNKSGAQGLMQLMPGTAREMGVTNSFDINQNVDGGTKYLAGMLKRFGGDVPMALAAYNAGPGAVNKHGGIPPFKETQDYVRIIMDIYKGGPVALEGLTSAPGGHGPRSFSGAPRSHERAGVKFARPATGQSAILAAILAAIRGGEMGDDVKAMFAKMTDKQAAAYLLANNDHLATKRLAELAPEGLADIVLNLPEASLSAGQSASEAKASLIAQARAGAGGELVGLSDDQVLAALLANNTWLADVLSETPLKQDVLVPLNLPSTAAVPWAASTQIMPNWNR